MAFVLLFGAASAESDGMEDYVPIENECLMLEQRGEMTMWQLKQYWNEFAWPEYIGSAVRVAGGFGELSEFTGYSRLYEVEIWEIGVLGDWHDYADEIAAKISNKCIVRFKTAQYSYNTLHGLYPDVVKRYYRDPAVGNIWIDGNRIKVRVSKLVYNQYKKSIDKKYQGAVVAVDEVGYRGFENYDDNLNSWPAAEPPEFAKSLAAFDCLLIAAFAAAGAGIVTAAAVTICFIPRKRRVNIEPPPEK